MTQSDIEDLEGVVVTWNEEADDIPGSWKTVVDRCFDSDPNKRIRLSELVKFWESAKYAQFKVK